MDSLNEEKKWKLSLYFFGHFGDGSPHINVLRPEGVSEEKFLSDAKLFEDALIKALLEFGGSLSAEHGVGLIRRDWLELRRSEPEKRLYHAIKAAFDPQGLLNPGKVLFA
jgi:FAD/FMN-containing dehydrogenase